MAENENPQNGLTKEGDQKEKMARFKLLDEVDGIVNRYTLWASATGLLPIPFVDLAALTVIQLKMVSSLSDKFNKEYSKSLAKTTIITLMGVGGTSLAFTPLASLLKGVPVIGMASGAVSMAALAAASTYALGTVVIVHFSSGGTLLSLDPEKMRTFYQAEFKKALKNPKQNDRKIP